MEAFTRTGRRTEKRGIFSRRNIYVTARDNEISGDAHEHGACRHNSYGLMPPGCPVPDDRLDLRPVNDIGMAR